MAEELQIFVGDRVVPASEAKVSVFDAGFQSGDAVWEGLRVYDGKVLRLAQHLTRLEQSAHALRITLPLGRQGIANAIQQTLDANAFASDTHIRLMVSRGSRQTSGMDPRNAPEQGTLVIIAERKPVEIDPAPQRLRTASIRRPHPQFVDANIHHSNQLNSILARLEILEERDIDATLMLDAFGYVAEADTATSSVSATESFGHPLRPRACMALRAKSSSTWASRQESPPSSNSSLSSTSTTPMRSS